MERGRPEALDSTMVMMLNSILNPQCLMLKMLNIRLLSAFTCNFNFCLLKLSKVCFWNFLICTLYSIQVIQYKILYTLHTPYGIRLLRLWLFMRKNPFFYFFYCQFFWCIFYSYHLPLIFSSLTKTYVNLGNGKTLNFLVTVIAEIVTQLSIVAPTLYLLKHYLCIPNARIIAKGHHSHNDGKNNRKSPKIKKH